MKQNHVGSGKPEVAAIGGGPTGLWVACELALAGVSVVVLERLAEPTGLSKALRLLARSMEMPTRPARRRWSWPAEPLCRSISLARLWMENW
jgi:glycine/D-amino acid oxidase-like deaminating enzyme